MNEAYIIKLKQKKIIIDFQRSFVEWNLIVAELNNCAMVESKNRV